MRIVMNLVELGFYALAVMEVSNLNVKGFFIFFLFGLLASVLKKAFKK